MSAQKQRSLALLPLVVALGVFSRAPLSFAQDSRPEAPEDTTQRDESRAAFRRGVLALQKQQWLEARDALLRAYILFPHPSILLDLGIARAHVGDAAAAEQDLTKFLAEDTGATPDELQTARSTLADVRTRIGTLRIRIAPPGATATLDDKPIALVASELADIRVARGSHVVEASAPGHVKWTQNVTIEGGDTQVIDLTLRSRAEADVSSTFDAQRVASFALFGTAVVAAGVGIFSGVRAVDLANQYNSPGEANYQNPSTKSQGITFRTAADVSLAISLACVAGGVFLYVWHPKPKQASVALVFGGFYGRF